jgi:hypothetical protein
VVDAADSSHDEPERVSFTIRLTRDELSILDDHAAHGSLKRTTLEDALRRYLQVIRDTGEVALIIRTHERRMISQVPARRYEIDVDLMRDLTEVSALCHCPKTQLIRQAILHFGPPAQKRSGRRAARRQGGAE